MPFIPHHQTDQETMLDVLGIKSATDLSYISVITADFNQILWFSYAYLQNDFSLLLSATGHFIICSTLLLTKIYYDRKKRLNEVTL